MRVAYQDQGDPIVMEPGDCVLQPPEIRHRVLECSDGLEVIEVGLPAIHETWADHGFEFSNSVINPLRLFGNQLFLHHQHQLATWEPSGPAFLKDMRVGNASSGAGEARVWRLEEERELRLPLSIGSRLLFVLEGDLLLEETGNMINLGRDECRLLTSAGPIGLRSRSGSEFLEIVLFGLPSI